MPQLTSLQGTVTATYKSGLKIDGVWHKYAESFRRVDLRAGDRVRCSLDAQSSVTELAITERGSGELAPETISQAQSDLLKRIADDRELSLADLEGRFLVPFKGKRLAELSKTEAGLLISFFFGRENRPGPTRGRR